MIARAVLLIFSFLPLMMFFTRKTIRKLAITRILVNTLLLGATVYFFYIEMVPNFYNDMQASKTIHWPITLEAKYRFWASIGFLFFHLLSFLVVLRFYAARTLKLKMIKNGGLTKAERGLVLGLASEGRSRTSTEINMGMKSIKNIQPGVEGGAGELRQTA